MPNAHLYLKEAQSDFRPIARTAAAGQLQKPITAVHMDGVSPGDMAKALALTARLNIGLGQILTANGMISEHRLLENYARAWSAPIIDLDQHPADQRLLANLSPEYCLKKGIIPWRQVNGATVIVTNDPVKYKTIKSFLIVIFGRCKLALAPLRAVQNAIRQLKQTALSENANIMCPDRFSCRSWAGRLSPRRLLFWILVFAVGVFVFPAVAMWMLVIWVTAYLAATTLLRLAAATIKIRSLPGGAATKTDSAAQSGDISKLPKVSILVPLFDEADILGALITRLRKTDYPKELLEVVLILEHCDLRTRQAVAKLHLPHWIRTITVPKSILQTKPRAMNYALKFCAGEIIGIYDAEDAPEADQIYRIARHFQSCGPKVVCIQGYLDFYNARQNWLSRCFTIEYAIWFRVLLHGIQKLGLPVPLGGTTFFIKRHALEELGAWDAHNVTEDADLGIRLARFGYQCAFVPTVTYEEANCHFRPWIKQRSRWLKGYAMTWITHMQRPVDLWQDLGPKGFFAVQIIFLGSLSSFLLAPAFWILWWVALGGSLPFLELLPPPVWWALSVAFIGTEAVLFLLGLIACSGKQHRSLMPWVAGMILYWPIGTIAVYKALYELIFAPFYWDKTNHGLSESQPDQGVS